MTKRMGDGSEGSPFKLAAMAYAELSPVAGLYALLLPTVAYTLLGSSRQLLFGPRAPSPPRPRPLWSPWPPTTPSATPPWPPCWPSPAVISAAIGSLVSSIARSAVRVVNA
jgi:Sulfate permease family